MEVETVEKKKLTYKFNDKWVHLPEFKDWLKPSPEKKGDSDLAFCKICQCTIIAHKSDLLKHRNAKKHKKNESKIGVPPAGHSAFQTPGIVKEDAKKAEMLLYEFMAEHKLPSHVTDRLVPLCKNIFPDSDIATHIASKRKKIAQNPMRVDLEKKRDSDILYMKLKVPGMFFSINMDEKTDQFGIIQYSLTVIFMDGENGVKYSSFDAFKLKPVPPKIVYLSLKNCLTSRSIPLENLVGFTSDPSSVPVEEHNAILSLLRKDCPDIACVRCSSHSVHLAASKACNKLPQTVEDLLRNLGSQFSSNYGRQSAFSDMQEFFHVDIHKELSTGITRWLSVKECVERVLDQYEPLQVYIGKISNDDNFETTQAITNTMNNPFTKAYLEFMSYVLGILDEFNVMFTAERPLLHKVKPEVEKLLKDICLNFLRTDYVRKTHAFELRYTDSRYYLPLDKIYLGVSASETLTDLKIMPSILETDVSSFFECILEFYVELVRVLREEFDFDDELYNIVCIVDPQVAQDFNTKSLVRVWKRFPALKKFTNIQALDNEWKKHALLDHQLDGLDSSMPADEYWRKVFHIRSAVGVQAFPNLYIVVKLLLALPFFPTELMKEEPEE